MIEAILYTEMMVFCIFGKPAKNEKGLNRKEIASLLLDLERKYPVERWEINGVNCWPIIRMHLFVKWYQRDVPIKGSIKKKSNLDKMPLLLKSLLYWLNIKQSDILCVGNSKQHQAYENYNGNRFYYLIEEIANRISRKNRYLCYDKPKTEINSKSFTDDYSLLRLWPVLLNKLNFRKTPAIHFEQFIELVADYRSNAKVEIESEQIIESIYAALARIFFLELPVLRKYINRVKPKMILQTTYYGPVGYCLNIIAHESNIPIVDIQHGGQGALHMGYARFTKVPKNGYKLLPKIFWCWDNESKKNIDVWSLKNNYHTALILGNPWVQFILDKDPKLKRAKRKKRILLTLQYNEIEPYILNVIDQTAGEYDWWIRFHPTLTDKKKTLVDLLLKRNKGNNIELESANSMNLVEILQETDVHISKFSGSIIEASLLGVYSVIIDKIGVDTYQEIVQNKRALVCIDNNEKQLLNALTEVSTLPTLKAETISSNEVESFVDSLLD